jgi:hypothetical protein
MLLAAEILIVGMAIFVVGGRGSFAAGIHGVDFSAASLAPVAAGAEPHIVIDDPNSRIHVGVSNDALVHIRDLTQIHGGIFSNRSYPQLRVTRTPDGVRIERPEVEQSFFLFGFSRQAVEVDAPQGAHIEIARCAGADVSDISGGVSVHSVDGHVTLTDLQGSIDALSDDGYLAATNVNADRLAMESMDGHLALRNVTVGSLTGTTHDGRIEADGLSVTRDATLQTDDDSVRLHLASNADLTVDASTRDGSISVDGNTFDGSDDSAQHTIRLGTGTGHLKLATADGSIRIFTNGESQ